jgi:hypothetical protein
MKNCMLGFPNRTDASVLSGGSWAATLPLSNLQSRLIGKVARSANTAPASTKFDVDLGAGTKIQAVCLRNHNISLAGTYRVTASTSSSFAALSYDSGWLDVWPVVYPWGTLEWEDDNFWTGKYTVEQTQGYTVELDHLLPTTKVARYWRVEISDTTNSDGYVQLGRLFIGPVWQPKINMSYGASVAWETKTGVQESIGGAEYFQPRTPYRVSKFSLNWMDQDEAFSQAFELMRRAGIDQEVLFIHDPDDTVHALRRRFLARLRTLSAIDYPYLNINSAAFEVKELL